MKTYADSFGYEWHKHKQTQVLDTEEAERVFWLKTGLSPEELKGKMVLDAGCGAGRFTQITAKYAKKVIGIDLSNSVEVAIANTRQFINSQIIRADINDMPFPDEYFDVVFSIGVIHHTPSTRQAFASLAKKVKKGGILSIWVYSNEGWKAKAFNLISGLHRLYTVRMNKDILYQLCKLAIPLYYLHRIPILGLFTIALFPCSIYPKAEWRVLDTFDWYSPKYQWKHSYIEVEKWFRELGFKDVQILEFPVSARGIK